MSLVKITCAGGESVEVNSKLLKMSNTIDTMFKGLGLDEEETAEIPLPNVKVETLDKVLVWCTYHQDATDKEGQRCPINATEEETRIWIETNNKNCTGWYKQYFEIPDEQMMDLIMAANFLDVTGLLEMSCNKVAIGMDGKNEVQMRRDYNLPDDLTDEEKAVIWKETAWIEESNDDDVKPEPKAIEAASVEEPQIVPPGEDAPNEGNQDGQ